MKIQKDTPRKRRWVIFFCDGNPSDYTHSMLENPGAYNEARNHNREKKEQENLIVEKYKEDFIENREKLRKKKKLDISELKRRIETGQSLESLKSAIREAIREWGLEWSLARETLDVIEKYENTEKDKKLPLQNNKITQFFEEAHLWDNVIVDIGGFLYGFVVQGSAILIIIAWKILTDSIFLPRDILHLTQKK